MISTKKTATTVFCHKNIILLSDYVFVPHLELFSFKAVKTFEV